MGSVYQNSAIHRVSRILPVDSNAELRQLVAGTYSSHFSSLSESTRTEVSAAIVSALTYVWAVLITAGALSFILAFLLGVSMPQLLQTFS